MKTLIFLLFVTGLIFFSGLDKVSGQLYLKSDGRVSIGTASPAATDKLTILQTSGKGIYSSISGAGVVSIYGYTSSSTGDNYALMAFHESNEGSAGYFLANNNNGGAPAVYARADGNILPASCGVVGEHYYGGIGVGAWSWSGDLIRGYSGSYPGGTLKFSVANDGDVYAEGKVGIGTTTPMESDKLTVVQTNGKAIFASVSGENTTAIYGYSSSSTGTNYAIYGHHNSTQGAAGYFLADNSDGTCSGVYARADGDAGFGIAGHNYYGGVGLGAWSYSGHLIEAFDGDYPGGTLRFYITQAGAVYADGGYNTFKSVQMPGEKQEFRAFYSIQGTEGWIEDIGSADLQNGEAIVIIDPVFAQAAGRQEDYKVFLTPVCEEMVCLVVAYKSPDSFTVKGCTLNGQPVSCRFDYRILSKDREAGDFRMEKVDIPDPVIIPRMD